MRPQPGSSSARWEASVDASRKLALHALMEKKTGVVLSIVLDRLYVLRNQLVHGGATWNSAANRQQVRDGAAILMAVVPVVVDILIDAADGEFGAVAYPFLPG